MEENDFQAQESELAAEFERKRRRKKKVRLWLGQPKRFNMVKKGGKELGKRKLESKRHHSKDRRTIPADICTTEEAMAASILLQMSTHGGHFDPIEEPKPIWSRDNKYLHTQPKGPSWIVDHDYAIQPQKYGSQRIDHYKRRSGYTKSKKASNITLDTKKGLNTNIEVTEQVQFSEPEITSSEIASTSRDDSNPHSYRDYEETGNVCYTSDQLYSKLESDTIFHLTENGEVVKFSQTQDSDGRDLDVAEIFDSIKGDVEYKTVVITDDDGNILQNWNESITYKSSKNGTATNEQQSGYETQPICSRCHQHVDPVAIETSASSPSPSSTSGKGPLQREQCQNAPDVIPMLLQQEKLQDPILGEAAQQHVNEIRNLSVDLVKNLENSNMLENFMVFVRTVAAGYVPDSSEIDTLKTMKGSVNETAVGIFT